MNVYKSYTNRMVFGVCGGIAERYGWDPSIVRLALVVLTCFSGFGPGIVGYVAAALIIPEAGRKTE